MVSAERITVIVPVFNAEATIDKCLGSLRSSEYTDFELLIVDDASTDKTAEKAAGYSCEVIGLKKNGGVGHARNVGVEKAKTELIVFIDADVFVRPDTITKLLDAYKSSPGHKIICGEYSSRYPADNFGAKFIALKTSYDYKWKQDEVFRKHSTVTADCCLIERSVFQAAGGFKEHFKGASVEDYDLAHRLIQQGYQPYIYRGILYDHYMLSLAKRAKDLFKRAAAYVPVFLARRRFESDGATGTFFESLMALFALLSVAGMAVSFAVPRAAVVPAVLLTIIAAANIPFYCYLFKKEGPVFGLTGLFALLWLYLSISLGVIVGIVRLMSGALRKSVIVSACNVWSAKIPHLVFFATGKCNLKCRHCFYWKQMEATGSDKELTLEEIDKITRKAGSVYYLTLTGGEPTLRKDIVDVIMLFYRNCGLKQLSFHTNGYLPETLLEITKKVVDSCPDMNLMISLSLDGPEDVHNGIRGKEGSFKKVLESIALLRDLESRDNFEMDVSTALTTYNRDRIKEVHRFVSEELHLPHNISLVRGDARNDDAKGNLQNIYREMVKVLAETEQRTQGSMFVSLRKKLSQVCRQINLDLLSKGLSSISCQALKKSIVISETGEVYPCEMLTEELGSLRENDFDVHKLMNSDKAEAIRCRIKTGACACTWECITPVNVVFSAKGMGRLLHRVLAF